MLYSIVFLNGNVEIDRFAFQASTAAELTAKLKQLLSDFHRRRPGAKDIMTVSAETSGLATPLTAWPKPDPI